jgi:hypothetical protein
MTLALNATTLPVTPKAGKSAFLNLLGGEVRQELGRFTALLRDLNHSAVQRTVLLRQAAVLDTLLEEVSKLAELDQRDEVFSDERLALAEVVRDILPQLPRLTGDDAIRYALHISSKDMAPVYGHGPWLRQALQTLLARLGRSCPPHGSVIIDLRQIGDFIVLNGRAAADTAGMYAVPATAIAVPPGEELRTEICLRIIALHGGQIKLGDYRQDVATDGGDAIDSITLTFPTGAPIADRSRVSCTECRIADQAMQYARDLATVMGGGAVSDNPPR